MAHIHFAWELGGGLGHAGRLKPLALEALRRGHQVSLSLRDVTQTQALLADLKAPIFQAPIWLHQVHGIPSPQISLAEVLQGCGYLNAGTLRGLFRAWHSLLGTLRPDVVVGDYAPTALLAARVLQLPHVAMGNSFYLPPAGQSLPHLRDWEAPQAARLHSAETRLLETANTVLGETGGPGGRGAAPLGCAADLFNGGHTLLQAWPELDPHQRTELPEGQRWWGPNVASSTGLAPEWPDGQNAQWPDGQGAKVFAYLKAAHPDHVLVLQALVTLQCRVECYMPEVASGKPPPLVHPLLHYAKAPVHLDQALAQADLCINHAGVGTLAATLLAGVPQLMLATQGEQFLMGRSLEAAGLGVNASAQRRPLDYAKLIRPLLGDSPYRHAAQAFAAKYKGFTALQQTVDLVDLFERLAAQLPCP